MSHMFPITVIFGHLPFGKRGSVDIDKRKNVIEIKKGDEKNEISFSEIKKVKVKRLFLRKQAINRSTPGETYKISVAAGSDSVSFYWDSSWSLTPKIDPEEATRSVISELEASGIAETKISYSRGNLMTIVFWLFLAAVAWYVFFV